MGARCWCWCSSCGRDATAQVLPEAPISVAGGHLVFGAEVSATFAPDDPGFFNYTSYEFSALRNLRLSASTEIRATDRVQVLGEVRLDQGRVLEAYGLFVRLRPWPARRFDIQAGRVPPTFGAMSRTAYGSSNLLIGQPLAYQYLTSIRPDALPGTRRMICCACARADGCRDFRSAIASTLRDCRSSAPADGTPACSCTASPGWSSGPER